MAIRSMIGAEEQAARSKPGVFTVSDGARWRHAQRMPSYLAETYTPQSSDVGAAAGRARLAAEQLTREGIPVRYVRSIFAREDEFCLYLFEADSADVVRRVGTRARLEFDRVVEAIEAAGGPEKHANTTGDTTFAETSTALGERP